jgi:MFS superfamily sulfate permease-like transporter
MNWFKNLTNPQKVILILITGVAAFIGLKGLSVEPEYNFSSGANQYPPYYVAAAITKALFSAILLLVSSSPLLYLTSRKEKVDLPTKQPLINWRRVATVVLTVLGLGLVLIVIVSITN